MEVFITGATGVLGSPTVRVLVQGGHRVRGVARGPGKAALLRSLGAEPVDVDLFDPIAVTRAVAGSEAVVHLATHIPAMTQMRSRNAWRENDRLRVDATRLLVDAAIKAQVKVFVKESVAFVYAGGGDAWLDEDAAVDAPSPSLLRSALDGERELTRLTAAGGAGIALRFGAFYAPYAPSTQETIRLARRWMFPVLGNGRNYVSSVHVDDAAAAVAAALSVPRGIYNVCDDDPVTLRDYVTALVQAFGLRRPFRLPAWIARPVLGAAAENLLRSYRVSNARFRHTTGWVPEFASVRQGWPAVQRAIAEDGHSGV